MNKKTVISLIVLVVLAAGATIAYQLVGRKEVVNNEGRTADLNNDFPNSQIEGAITKYLLSQNQFSWKTTEDSHNFCGIENLDPEKELFPIYVWAYCGEYITQDNDLINLSGYSVPAEINYPNELSFYDTNRFSFRSPRDGSFYTDDVINIFPENVQQKIFNFNAQKLIDKVNSEATESLKGI